tara:strand:- start:1406 stop:1894 length:489 start_codon:yes stop_codon:yes gene_type:complete
MNQQKQTGINPLLLGGITRNAHLANIKNSPPPPSFKTWLKRQYRYIARAKDTKNRIDISNAAIRKNLRKTKDANGNECAYVVRLLGAGNAALGITIANKTVSVFPQTTFIKAKNCLEALVSAISNDEEIYNEVVDQLKEKGYEDIPEFGSNLDKLVKEVSNG